MNNWFRQIPSGFGILPSLAVPAYLQQLLASRPVVGDGLTGWTRRLRSSSVIILGDPGS